MSRLLDVKDLIFADRDYKHVSVCNLKDTPYSSYFSQPDLQYCEYKAVRDRSSFGGVIYKKTDKPGIEIIDCDDTVLADEGSNGKLRLGFEESYIDALLSVYNSCNFDFGIEVYGLVYSDVKSSPIVFESIMKAMIASCIEGDIA